MATTTFSASNGPSEPSITAPQCQHGDTAADRRRDEVGISADEVHNLAAGREGVGFVMKKRKTGSRTDQLGNWNRRPFQRSRTWMSGIGFIPSSVVENALSGEQRALASTYCLNTRAIVPNIQAISRLASDWPSPLER